MRVCVAGYEWLPVGGDNCCAAGACFVSHRSTRLVNLQTVLYTILVLYLRSLNSVICSVGLELYLYQNLPFSFVSFALAHMQKEKPFHTL